MNAQTLNDLPLDGEIEIKIKKVKQIYGNCFTCFLINRCNRDELNCHEQGIIYIEVKE